MRLGDLNFSCADKIEEAARDYPSGDKWRATRSQSVRVRTIRHTKQIVHCLARTHDSYLCGRACGARFVFFAALLLATLFPWTESGTFAGQSATEYQVKAAYLFNFLKFVEWPDDPAADPHGKWVIGFIGDTPIGDELAQVIAGKNVLGRDLQVKKFRAADNLRACNILFISESENKRLPPILAELRGSSVLTVADMDNFIGSGGMIQFVVEDARVRVAIDVGATSRARLKVSSKLLSLARTVTGSDRGASN